MHENTVSKAMHTFVLVLFVVSLVSYAHFLVQGGDFALTLGGVTMVVCLVLTVSAGFIFNMEQDRKHHTSK